MILTIEIGLTIAGLLAIVKQQWSLGHRRPLNGPPAVIVGFICLLTIPVVYVATAYLSGVPVQDEAWSIETLLNARLNGNYINGLLIELVVLLIWFTAIISLSGLLAWFTGRQTSEEIPPPTSPSIIEAESEEPERQFELDYYPEPEQETESTWEKRNLPLSDSVDSEVMLR